MATLGRFFSEQVSNVSHMKVYRGKRLGFDLVDGNRGVCGVTVSAGGEDPVSLNNVTGRLWEWGYRGSLATNLARSILADFFGYDKASKELVAMFRDKFVSQFRFNEWFLEEHVIDGWLDVVENNSMRVNGK